MQCFICVTYMMFACSALPTIPPHEQRSLFQDVINSLKIHTKLSEDLSQNNENNLAQNYEIYKYGEEAEGFQLPSDSEFIPRRNDRLEMPTLRHRLPKSLNDSVKLSAYASDQHNAKEEFILYVTTSQPKPTTTINSKKTNPKKTKPVNQINKVNNKNVEDSEVEDPVTEEVEQTSTADKVSSLPTNYNMSGQSHIGNRESQIVVKPTVILNFRGTIHHRDSDIKVASRKTDENYTVTYTTPQNIFNIKQEIILERTMTDIGDLRHNKKKDAKKDQKNKNKISNSNNISEINQIEDDHKNLTDSQQQGRSASKVFQILVNV